MSTAVTAPPLTERRPRWRAAVRKVDPLLPVVCLVAALVYLLNGFDGGIRRDSAFYVYAGQLIAEGVPPYVELFNRSGPFAHLLPGLGVFGARLVGGDDIVGARVVFMLISVASVGLAYALGRDVFRYRPAGLAAAAAVLSLNAFSYFATQGPRDKTVAVLCLLAVLLAVTHQRWVLTGVIIAAGTLTWQPMFFTAITTAGVAILLGASGRRLRALAGVVVGGAVPALLTLLAFLLVGHLKTFLDAFLLVNARYTRQPGAAGQLDEVWGGLVRGYGWSVWVLVAGMVALLVTAAVTAWTHRRSWDPLSAVVVGAGIGLLVNAYWTLNAYNAWPDSLAFIPAAALGIAAVAATLHRHAPRRVALAGTLAWVLVAVGLAGHHSVTDRSNTLDRQRRLVAELVDAVPPGARIAAVQAPLPLVLTRQRAHSRFQIFGLGIKPYLDDIWPGGIRGHGRWLVRQEPALVATQAGAKLRWLMAPMADDYVPVGESGGIAWFVDTRLGAEAVAEVREAFEPRS